MTSETLSWHIHDSSSEIVGPLSTEEVIDAIRAGRISLLAMARPSDESDFRPLVYFWHFQSIVLDEATRMRQS